jgi:hypothetical protein
MIAQGGAGSLQSGNIQCKIIIVSALLDGNLPWCANWYRELVRTYIKDAEDDMLRLWYVDNAVHSDESMSSDESHIAGYFGVLHQTLLDLSDWVERGVSPAPSTGYRMVNNIVAVSEDARDRFGIQPLVTLLIDGKDSVVVTAGEPVNLNAMIGIPKGAGVITKIEWRFNDDEPFLEGLPNHVHAYTIPGVYFPVVRVSINRYGNASDPFTQVKNISRVRVTVTEAAS